MRAIIGSRSGALTPYLVALSALAGFAASSLPATAYAQSSSDPVAARTLFQDARKLASQGKFEAACPKFEESLNLDPGIGTMFNLADCWEHVGKTASAWSRFLDAASAAKNAGQQERERVARQRAAAIEPHLSHLTITVAVASPGLSVHDGSRTVGPSLFGVAVPVDPGAHPIEATAPGKKPWEGTVQVGPDGAQVAVAVPALANDDTAPPPSSVAATPALPPESTVPQAEPPPPARGRTQRIAGWITAGAGVAGVAVGAAFGIVTRSKNSDAESLCPTLTCSQSDYDRHATLVSDAKSARTASIVGFAAGGAALVGGVVLLLTAPKAHQEALSFVPVVGQGQLGAAVLGAW